MMGFVDDQYRSLFALQGQAGDFGADNAKGGGAVALGGQAQFPGDGFVHIHDVAGGERDVEEAIQAGVQGGGDASADGGFAAAGFAGEQPNGAQLQQVIEPDLGLAVGGGVEQRGGVWGLFKRIVGEGEVFLVHGGYSGLARRRSDRREGSGSGAGVSAVRVSFAGV